MKMKDRNGKPYYLLSNFDSPVQCTRRAIALPLALTLAVAVVVSALAKCLSFMLKFYVKVFAFFYLMGKALSVELSCMQTGLVCLQFMKRSALPLLFNPKSIKQKLQQTTF